MMAVRMCCASAERFFMNKHFGQSVRRVVSALHIPGNVAQAAALILTPSLDHIDRLVTIEKETTQKNLVARNMSSFPLPTFIEDWQKLKKLQLQREDLEERRIQVSNQLQQITGELLKKLPSDKKPKKTRGVIEQVIIKHGLADKAVLEEIEQLREEGKKLRSQLKDFMPLFWDVEEKAMTRALSLPNALHPDTPLDAQDRVIQSFGLCPAGAISGQPLKDVHSNLDHVSPTAYYLEGKAALLELEWIQSFSHKWIDSGFNLISAPDFVKSIVIDGCALNFNDPHRVMCLAAVQDHGNLESGNGLHLVGGASLPAVVAFLTKNVIQSPYPLRLVSTGRNYQPSPVNSAASGLLATSQSSAIQVLTALENDLEILTKESSSMEKLMIECLQQLVIFQIVNHSCN